MMKTFTWMSCLLAMVLATPAHAGGVIIDGWDDNTTMSCNQACQALLEGEEVDETEQEIYLIASMVFKGHAAASTADDGLTDDDVNGDSTADDSEIGVDDPDEPLPTPVLDEIEADLGGCAAAPGGGLAALAAFLLLRRRRR